MMQELDEKIIEFIENCQQSNKQKCQLCAFYHSCNRIKNPQLVYCGKCNRYKGKEQMGKIVIGKTEFEFCKSCCEIRLKQLQDSKTKLLKSTHL